MQLPGKTVRQFFKKLNSFHMTHVGNFMVRELHAVKEGNSTPILRVFVEST